jgi:hypothetical protein
MNKKDGGNNLDRSRTRRGSRLSSSRTDSIGSRNIEDNVGKSSRHVEYNAQSAGVKGLYSNQSKYSIKGSTAAGITGLYKDSGSYTCENNSHSSFGNDTLKGYIIVLINLLPK